ncbi:MAG: hypothetical protein ABI968_10745 [Acidobacteriota bacterium]
MLRLVLIVFAVFLFLTVLRGLRIFWAAVFRRPGADGEIRRGATPDQEMVRDPVCGVWVDRRLALAGRRGSEWVPVCSEKCQKALEAR